MERLFLSYKSAKKIKSSLSKLEKALGVKLSFEGSYLVIEGDAVKEYDSLEVLKAVSAGFEAKTALLLLNEEIMLDEVRIKDYVKQSRLRTVKARVIGKEGKALKTMADLSDCVIKLSDNSVFIIGDCGDVKNARNAVVSLIKGSKHSNVYSRLEHKPNFGEDLHLRPEKKNSQKAL